MVNRKLPAIWFGGDYNPDQWDEKTWQEDIRLMKEQHVNVVTLPVFSWAHIQPDEDEYDFGWLDRIIGMLYENGIHVILATPTAAQPAWMSKRYPDILPTDISGRKKHHGARNNFCPNSREYRRFSSSIAERMAERYKDSPAVVMSNLGGGLLAREYVNWGF